MLHYPAVDSILFDVATQTVVMLKVTVEEQNFLDYYELGLTCEALRTNTLFVDWSYGPTHILPDAVRTKLSDFRSNIQSNIQERMAKYTMEQQQSLNRGLFLPKYVGFVKEWKGDFCKQKSCPSQLHVVLFS